MTDYQIMFNIAFTFAGAMGGWVLSRITRAIDQLDGDVRHLPEKYVLKSDYVDGQKRIEDKLDQIFRALNGKADRGGGR